MSLNDITPAQWDAMCEYKKAGPAEVPVEPVNFKANQGITKPPLELVPLTALAYIAAGMQEGARKYGSASWRDVPSVDLNQYVGATMRHLMAYADGEDIDPDSGNHHIAHAIASLAIMCELLESENGTDTRPKKPGPGPQTLAAMTQTGGIQE